MSLDYADQAETEKRKREILEIFEKRRHKKFIDLDEFLQVCKDYEMYGALGGLKVHNSSNLMKYVITKQQTVTNTTNLS